MLVSMQLGDCASTENAFVHLHLYLVIRNCGEAENSSGTDLSVTFGYRFFPTFFCSPGNGR